MENNASPLKDLFKHTLVDFLDSLINILPTEPDLIVARIYVNDKMASDDLINYFIIHFMKFKDHIKNKNETFFLEFKNYTCLPDEKVNNYKSLWTQSINKDNKIVIWKWLASFMKIVEKYQATK
jgi:hypothetical protein